MKKLYFLGGGGIARHDTEYKWRQEKITIFINIPYTYIWHHMKVSYIWHPVLRALAYKKLYKTQ